MIIFYIVDGDGNKNKDTMGILIKCSGKQIPVFPKNESIFKLREVQELIGGDIEVLPINIDSVMVIVKECESAKLPFNSRATYIACRNDVFRSVSGDVLICASDEIE